MNKQQILAKMTPEQLKKMNIPVKPEATTPVNEPTEPEEKDLETFPEDLVSAKMVWMDFYKSPVEEVDINTEGFSQVVYEDYAQPEVIHTSSSESGSTLTQPDAKLEVVPGPAVSLPRSKKKKRNR
jgi:hypothetical protein